MQTVGDWNAKNVQINFLIRRYVLFFMLGGLWPLRKNH